MESPSNGDLPADIILEILFRLPVKTLLRFKCVCKHWHTLIGSPSFVNQHFDHESNRERLLIRHDGPNEKKYAFALYVDEMCSGYEEPNHLQMPDTVATLLGPLNGVFCLVSKSRRMALLNPAMRQFKPLPLFHRNVQPRSSFYDYYLGFGLDPLSGDYKLVLIQYFCNEEMDVLHYPPLVSVYSSGTDSWRHLEDVDLVDAMDFAYKSLCNTYLNGVYYWLVEPKDFVFAILAFDMSSEKFQKIQVPDCIQSVELELRLALYGDSIALLSHDDSDFIDKFIDVWVMEEGGCWTKSYTVGPLQGISWPLGFLKNHELLIEGGAPLLTLYNVSTKKSRTVEFRGRENGFFHYWVFSYKESLVSIKGERGNCKLWDTSSDFVKDFFKSSSSKQQVESAVYALRMNLMY